MIVPPFFFLSVYVVALTILDSVMLGLDSIAANVMN